QSARFNAAIVFIKLLTIAVFITVAVQQVDLANWTVFLPFGWSGVIHGAALVFFAYIGFDALSTAVEETIDPQRNAPIGILASLVICTLIYIVVAGLLTSIVPYTTLNVPSPVADALLHLGHHTAAAIVAAGAVAGLTTVMLVMYYGLTRIILAMSRDGLLPGYIACIHPNTCTPIRIIIITAVITGTIAALTPIGHAAELVNIGTLAAFTLVCGGVIILRVINPDLPRPFKVPFMPWFPLLGVFSCFYLMLNLATITWWRFWLWMAIGLIVYFCYSRKRSHAASL
ncbi:MAG TPA: amino acid permease, partial [Gammaproteobacteria bacterium]|nr:amino acid permease [Gammaproteobacteria bacterium]